MLFDTNQRVFTSLKVDSTEVVPGRYEFAIYQWRFHGIKDDLILKPIASSEQVTEHLEDLLEKAIDVVNANPNDLGSNDWEELDIQHYKLWSDARVVQRQETLELAEYRRESLKTSHKARISLLDEQLKMANNEKIVTTQRIMA